MDEMSLEDLYPSVLSPHLCPLPEGARDMLFQGEKAMGAFSPPTLLFV